MPFASVFSKRRVLMGSAAVAVLLLLLQLLPLERTNPPVVSDLLAPEDVREVLRRSCYDCHSHETRWPWYSRIRPMGWLIADHVREGRSDLNFSEWPILDFDAEALLLEDIQKEILEQEMPLPAYLLLHPEARLSENDRQILLEWSR